MKAIFGKAKKRLAAACSEVPALCELCKVAVRLTAKAVTKQDATSDKSAFAELRAKTKNAQIAFGLVLVLFVGLCITPFCSVGCTPKGGIYEINGEMVNLSKVASVKTEMRIHLKYVKDSYDWKNRMEHIHCGGMSEWIHNSLENRDAYEIGPVPITDINVMKIKDALKRCKKKEEALNKWIEADNKEPCPVGEKRTAFEKCEGYIANRCKAYACIEFDGHRVELDNDVKDWSWDSLESMVDGWLKTTEEIKRRLR